MIYCLSLIPRLNSFCQKTKNTLTDKVEPSDEAHVHVLKS